jgi:hypothetical protein
MRIIFSDFQQARSRLKNHAPSVIAEAEEAAPLLPTKIRRLLAQQP